MIVEINKEYKHKYLKSLTCIVLAETHKGWKVKQRETFSGRKRTKETIQYYLRIDFDAEKGLWLEM